ncbi:hypothetical protein EDEG_02806 [Edhazardia aedis USNM 41457]|uniref:Uncharacterized protein n=1 Tax=Edhazardia aedis (strain USNM 41457) TaxID=1003232 RepID=J9DJL1_EDHAE|nr:hypothetical protein EDEG_02806 [Edhazardia aedis USNM 41457]|eukprot:EJW02810.1 hypothetical protein EDEG_02806 [Edhazardia aedis USNM 41457]
MPFINTEHREHDLYVQENIQLEELSSEPCLEVRNDDLIVVVGDDIMVQNEIPEVLSDSHKKNIFANFCVMILVIMAFILIISLVEKIAGMLQSAFIAVTVLIVFLGFMLFTNLAIDVYELFFEKTRNETYYLKRAFWLNASTTLIYIIGLIVFFSLIKMKTIVTISKP